jgi:hypothetical protein
VTNGHGGSCGSAFLDVNMREYIKRKFSHLGSINDTAMEHIMDTFVNIIKASPKRWSEMYDFLPSFVTLSLNSMGTKITFWIYQHPWA